VQDLTADNNKIVDLPDSLESMTWLRKIELNSNGMTAFPRVLTRMPFLSILILYGNAISDYPPEISNMVSVLRDFSFTLAFP
jgi:Leucine-rich repeat (LRR) protein